MANTKDYEEVKLMAKTLSPNTTSEEMAAHLEDALR